MHFKILCPIEAYQVAIYREWVIKIPIILIVGVATLDALRNTLASNALQCLFPRGFTLGTPAERMDAIVEAVLLKHYHGFSIGKQVTTFLRNFFLRHDGTLTSFIRALKVCIGAFAISTTISFLFPWFTKPHVVIICVLLTACLL